MQQIDKYVLYGIRLLVFLEESPQSNEYRQVVVDPKKFKEISDAVCKVEEKEGDEELVSIRLSEEIYKLPDLREIHETL